MQFYFVYFLSSFRLHPLYCLCNRHKYLFRFGLDSMGEFTSHFSSHFFPISHLRCAFTLQSRHAHVNNIKYICTSAIVQTMRFVFHLECFILWNFYYGQMMMTSQFCRQCLRKNEIENGCISFEWIQIKIVKIALRLHITYFHPVWQDGFDLTKWIFLELNIYGLIRTSTHSIQKKNYAAQIQ